MRSLRARTKKALAVALALAVVATGYLIATKERAMPPQESVAQPAEITQSDPIASTREHRTSPPRKPDEAISQPELANHAATTRQTFTEVVALALWREDVAKELVVRGLAPADSEQIAERFAEGLADCLLEAARKEYESAGKPDGNEMSWTQTMAYISLNRVQSAAVPCAANIGQQTGIPLPADFGSAGSRSDDIPLEPASPPWAPEMEARIRDYIASYSAPAIKAVLVKCIDQGCNVTLVGRDIRIFDLEFDVFAENNGFQHAVLRGDGGFRFVWLQR